jgi:hypothetical protein
MLQNIIKGMAAIGSNTCKRMAPAAAENAKPENPLTKPPRKTAVESIASSTGACIRVPLEGRESLPWMQAGSSTCRPPGRYSAEWNACMQLSAAASRREASVARLRHCEPSPASEVRECP